MRRIRRTLLLALPAAALLVTPVSAQSTTTLHVPTQADGQAAATQIESILNGPRSIETLLPGPASDDEAVTVGIGLDGEPVRVHVAQRLVIHGLGDFQFKVPGPAREVEALPGSENEPGLRRGAVLWQGFSSGTKRLGAAMELFPNQEAGRLPVRVELRMTVDGAAVDFDRPVTGAFEMRITLVNQTPIPIGVSSGDAEPGDIDAAIDATQRVLRRGDRPVPGHGGVPESIDVSGAPVLDTVPLEAPMRFSASVAFPAGQLRDPTAPGTPLEPRLGGMLVSFDGVLGGGLPLERTFVIRGDAHRLELPNLGIDVLPAPPSSTLLAKTPADVRERVALFMRTMWQVARLRQFDSYLGNPDPAGPATSTFRYILSPLEERAPVTPAGAASPVPILIGLSLGGLLALFGLAWAWARS